jgi:hypothetical protein
MSLSLNSTYGAHGASRRVTHGNDPLTPNSSAPYGFGNAGGGVGSGRGLTSFGGTLGSSRIPGQVDDWDKVGHSKDVSSGIRKWKEDGNSSPGEHYSTPWAIT